jgi:hypothetical protein
MFSDYDQANTMIRGEAFRPTSELFGGTGFDQALDTALDAAQVGMLDGRTIHFHFQFVEPVLLLRYPGCIYTNPGEPLGALSLPQVVAQQWPEDLRVESLTSRFDNSFDLYGVSDRVGDARPRLTAALDLLAAHHLDWLPTIATGAIHVGDKDWSRSEFSVCVRSSADVVEMAYDMLLQSAANLASAWIAAESSCLGYQERLTIEASRFASDLFASLMAEELERRRLAGSIALQRGASPEEPLAQFPLTRHLVSFWDRRWNRQAFLRGSIFDYAPSLNALYDCNAK